MFVSFAQTEDLGILFAKQRLIGLREFHAVTFRGTFYPLPGLFALCFGDALHLIKARHRIAHVGGIF